MKKMLFNCCLDCWYSVPDVMYNKVSSILQCRFKTASKMVWRYWWFNVYAYTWTWCSKSWNLKTCLSSNWKKKIVILRRNLWEVVIIFYTQSVIYVHQDDVHPENGTDSLWLVNADANVFKIQLARHNSGWIRLIIVRSIMTVRDTCSFSGYMHRHDWCAIKFNWNWTSNGMIW